MTRILIIGTVPAALGARAEALGRLAADHLAMGDRVEVWSADAISVAHLHDRLAGLRVPLRLLVSARRFDAVVLRVQNGLPFPHRTGRLARAALFVSLGAALRRYGQVTIRLDAPIAIPGGVGGRPTRAFWDRAHVVVENDEDRERILAIPWIDAARVEVCKPAPDASRAATPEWPKPDTADLRSAVMEVVRVRATAVRRLEQAGTDLAPGTEARTEPKSRAEAKAAAKADALVRAKARDEAEARRDELARRDLAAAFAAAGDPGRPGLVMLSRVGLRGVLGRGRRVAGRLRALARRVL